MSYTISVLISLGSALMPQGAGASPAQVVSGLQGAWQEQARTEDLRRRSKELLGVVRATHDAMSMAKSLAGKLWQGLDEAQRKRLAGAILRLRAAELAARAGEVKSFAAAEEAVTGEQAEVESLLLQTNGKGVPLHYRLRRLAGEWRITAISEDGHPWPSARQPGAAAEMARGGFPRLLDELEQRAASYLDGAVEAIERLQARLLSVMKKAHELGYEGRYQRLAPVVGATHQIAFMGRYALGSKNWKSLDAEQRARFVSSFEALSVATYAAKFDGYNGETFAVSRPAKKGRKGSVVVESHLTKSNGDKVSFQYLMRRRAHRWRIINIVVDGVSDLATKRSEYKGIMATEGFAALLAKIRAKIDRYREDAKD